MGTLLDKIGQWIKDGLIESIMGKFTDLFLRVNEQAGDIANQVGKSPANWNPDIFNMIKNLSETVVLPIAGVILTFIMVYELIQMVIDKNNLNHFETFSIYKWVFKTFVAVLILTNCFNLVMAVFDLAQEVVNDSAGLIGDSLEVEATLENLEEQLKEMSMWGLLGLWLETHVVGLCLDVLSVVIFIIVWGRIIEIYFVISLAPIPMSTMVNRDWGTMGNNYFKSLFAVAFQGFLIMITIAIYAVLVKSIGTAESVHAAIWGTAGYTALLAFALFKTGSLAKSIFHAQ